MSDEKDKIEIREAIAIIQPNNRVVPLGHTIILGDNNAYYFSAIPQGKKGKPILKAFREFNRIEQEIEKVEKEIARLEKEDFKNDDIKVSTTIQPMIDELIKIKDDSLEKRMDVLEWLMRELLAINYKDDIINPIFEEGFLTFEHQSAIFLIMYGGQPSYTVKLKNA